MAGFDEMLSFIMTEDGTFDFERAKREVYGYYQASPGFFKPFGSWRDFAGTAVSPIAGPLGLGLVTSVLTCVVGIATGFCLASLLAGGVSSLLGNASFARTAFTLAAIGAVVAGVSTLLAVAGAILTVLALPVTLAYLTTRSAATGIAAIRSCFANKSNDAAPSEKEAVSNESQESMLQPAMS